MAPAGEVLSHRRSRGGVGHRRVRSGMEFVQRPCGERAGGSCAAGAAMRAGNGLGSGESERTSLPGSVQSIWEGCGARPGARGPWCRYWAGKRAQVGRTESSGTRREQERHDPGRMVVAVSRRAGGRRERGRWPVGMGCALATISGTPLGGARDTMMVAKIGFSTTLLQTTTFPWPNFSDKGRFGQLSVRSLQRAPQKNSDKKRKKVNHLTPPESIPSV